MKKVKLIAEKETLKNRLRVLEASQLSTICSAFRNIEKCGQDHYMASGVTITIKNINNTKNILVDEVCISDGLSPNTIDAIKSDIKRSYDLMMSYPHNKIPEDTK